MHASKIKVKINTCTTGSGILIAEITRLKSVYTIPKGKTIVPTSVDIYFALVLNETTGLFPLVGDTDQGEKTIFPNCQQGIVTSCDR